MSSFHQTFADQYTLSAYNSFAAVSTATREAAEEVEIRFADDDYDSDVHARDFALRNAHRVSSLGAFRAPDYASIDSFSLLRELKLKRTFEADKFALLPRALEKLDLRPSGVSIDWEPFQRLGWLRELKLFCLVLPEGRVQLGDSFANALPNLTTLWIRAVFADGTCAPLAATAKMAMPRMDSLTLCHVDLGHLGLDFMPALRTLSLCNSTVSSISTACSTLQLTNCQLRVSLLLPPTLRSLTVIGGGPHRLDRSLCRQTFTFAHADTPVEWVWPEHVLQMMSKMKI